MYLGIKTYQTQREALAAKDTYDRLGGITSHVCWNKVNRLWQLTVIIAGDSD